MTARVLSLPAPRVAGVALAGVLTAALVGVAIAARIPLGLALMTGAGYAALVFLDFPLAVALWVPLVFLEGFPSLNLAGKAAGLLLVGGWVGTLGVSSAASRVFRRHRRLIETLVLLQVWMALSLIWAPDFERAWGDLWHWWAVALVFFIVATSITTRRSLLFVVGGFVIGAVFSVLAGLITGDLTAETAAVGTANASARLEIAAGDPNFLAAGLVSAIVLAAGLAAALRSPAWRWLLVVTILVLAAGVMATQSRGAIAAAFVTGIAAVVFFKRRRKYVVALGLLAAGAAALSLSLDPAAWERVSSFDNSGSGRNDLWTVAWRVYNDHPWTGVGVNNFGVVSGNYVRESGVLERVNLIADKPHVVHNVYLQFLAENGIPGLLLFLVLAIGCLRAAWIAGNRFEAAGRADLEAVARSILVAGIAMLASAFFISNGVDRRLWILLALGPAVLEIASRSPDRAPTAPGPSLSATHTSRQLRRSSRTTPG